MTGLARRLAGALPRYLRIAWWGLVSPRVLEREPLVVYQGVIFSDRGVLLSVRSDLRGWELPGGNAGPGESAEAALRREVLEETGLEIAVGREVGRYVRTGFRPYTARVFACRVVGGSLRPSEETPVVRWSDPRALPSTLFAWYRAPLADALSGLPEPVVRHEYQGVRAVLAAMGIDLRMRLSGDRAGWAP
ncbi:MAG: NUDIX domain-containing protein [Myxococcota bacterium]